MNHKTRYKYKGDYIFSQNEERFKAELYALSINVIETLLLSEKVK